LKQKIKEDTKIILEIEGKTDIEGRQEILSFSSRVEEVEGDGCLLVHMPIYKGGHYMLPRDRLISVYSFIEDKMFLSTALYQGRVASDNLVYARLRSTSNLRQVQRRNCYRLQMSLPIEILQIDPFLERETRSYGQMVNISDTGMLFLTSLNIRMTEVIGLTFDLGTEKEPDVQVAEGKVVRLETLYGVMYSQRVAVGFVNMPMRQRDKLYKYIMGKQREKMRQ